MNVPTAPFGFKDKPLHLVGNTIFRISSHQKFLLTHMHNTKDTIYWLFIEHSSSTFLLSTSPSGLSEQTAVQNFYEVLTKVIVEKNALESYRGQSNVSDRHKIRLKNKT